MKSSQLFQAGSQAKTVIKQGMPGLKKKKKCLEQLSIKTATAGLWYYSAYNCIVSSKAPSSVEN